MKKLTFAVFAMFLTLSGVTLAQQSGDQKKGSSMMESMPEVMKGKTGEGDMSGMMGMMKMMEQCNDMMKSMPPVEKDKETQRK